MLLRSDTSRSQHAFQCDLRPHELAAQLARSSNTALRRNVLDSLARCADGPDVRRALKYPFAPPRWPLSAYEEELAACWSPTAARELMAQLTLMSTRLRASGKDTLVIINHTFLGGGVAEMFQTQADILHQLGLRVEWYTTQAESDRYTEIGRQVSDALQGANPQLEPLDLHTWARENARLATILRHLAHDDRIAAVFLEDHHPIHLIEHFKRLNPRLRLVWRCHDDYCGIVAQRPAAMHLWHETMLPQLQRLDDGDVALFQPGSIPGEAGSLRCAAFTQAPGINPLAPKNVRLAPNALADLLSVVAPGVDADRQYLVAGGRYVAWKGMLPLLRAFSQIAPDFPDIDLLLFGTVSQGDPRKVQYIHMIEQHVAWMQHENAALVGRVQIIKDCHDGIRAFYSLAARHHLPFLEWSLREGYGLMADEAARQGAVPSTTWQGGLCRYANEPTLRSFGLDVADLVDGLPEPYAMYRYDSVSEGLAPRSPSVTQLEAAFANKLRSLLHDRRQDFRGYAQRYAAAAQTAHHMALRHSLVSMSRDYLACCLADPTALQAARRSLRGCEPLAPAHRLLDFLP